MKTYSRATSGCAKDFLAQLIVQAPLKIRSLQVDGGSEFRDVFEQANGTSRYEFYPLYESR